MFAYTWPLLNLFWTFLMFAGIFLLLFFIIWCFVDNSLADITVGQGRRTLSCRSA